MSSNVTLNGVQYTIPAYNDTGWAQGTGNLSLYLAAIASNTLQPTGGAFTLTSELDFGANFGVKQLYLKSETANPASAGVIRLASVDTIRWRNNANGADIALSKDSSDNLQYNATKVLLSGAVVNADINAAAAIAYTKLALSNSIVNADINSAAAIAYSKLALSASIVNADIASAAAIAHSKMAALTISRALVSDGSGIVAVSAVTSTELGYVSGVTSAIQTQLNATIANPLTANLAAGSHKLTGLAAGTTAGDSVRFEQLGVQLLQRVFFSTTSSTSTSSATYVATALTQSFTPKSASSRIKITMSGMVGLPASATSGTTCFTIARDGTNLAAANGLQGFRHVDGTNSMRLGVSYFIDEPSPGTSAVTYDVRFKNDSSVTVTFNELGGTACLMIEEWL